MAELEGLAHSDVRRTGLGALGGVAAGAPPSPGDSLSAIARTAARWERAHDAMDTLSLLTRDLRSATAQLRTACGYASHLAAHLLCALAGMDARQQLDLKTLAAGLRAVDAGAVQASKSWHRRVSDLNGQGNTPGEIAFLDLELHLTASFDLEVSFCGPTSWDRIDVQLWGFWMQWTNCSGRRNRWRGSSSTQSPD
jgi:hypothetical protein